MNWLKVIAVCMIIELVLITVFNLFNNVMTVIAYKRQDKVNKKMNKQNDDISALVSRYELNQSGLEYRIKELENTVQILTHQAVLKKPANKTKKVEKK